METLFYEKVKRKPSGFFADRWLVRFGSEFSWKLKQKQIIKFFSFFQQKGITFIGLKSHVKYVYECIKILKSEL